MKTILVTGGAGFIGSNFVRVFLGDRRPANENLDLLAHSSLFEGVDSRFHRGHGSGEESGHRHNVRAFFFDSGDEFLGRHIDAQVDDFEAAAFEE